MDDWWLFLNSLLLFFMVILNFFMVFVKVEWLADGYFWIFYGYFKFFWVIIKMRWLIDGCFWIFCCHLEFLMVVFEYFMIIIRIGRWLMVNFEFPMVIFKFVHGYICTKMSYQKSITDLKCNFEKLSGKLDLKFISGLEQELYNFPCLLHKTWQWKKTSDKKNRKPDTRKLSNFFFCILIQWEKILHKQTNCLSAST